MISMMRLFFFLSIFLGLFFTQSKSAHAAPQCVYILGDKYDWNNAFRSMKTRFDSSRTPEGSNFGKFNCKGFNSWKEADAYLQASNLQLGEQILAVQYAHGSPGGGAVINAGNINSNDINTFIQKYSKDYFLGMVLVTCYSGDLLKYIVKNQFETQTANKNFCLMPVSPIGEVGFGFDPLQKESPNLTSMYFNYSFQFTSSAVPFSEIGLDQFWNDKINAETALALFVNKVSQFSHLSSTQKKLLNIAIDKRFRYGQRLNSSAENRILYARALLQNALEQQEQLLLTQNSSTEQQTQNQCRQLVIPEIKAEAQLGDEALIESISNLTLLRKLSELQKTQACQKIIKRGHLQPINGSGILMQVDFLKLFDDFPYFDDAHKTTDGLDLVHFILKYAGMQGMKNPGYKIPSTLETYSLLEKTPEFLMSTPRSDGDARMILLSMIGSWDSAINLKRLFSTPESLQSSSRLDQTRKKACDDFTLTASSNTQ